MSADERNNSPWSNRVGPFCTESSVSIVTGLTPTEVHSRVSQGTMLQVQSDGAVLYPTFQFNHEGEVPKNLQNFISIMNAYGFDGWAIELLLVTSARALDGRTPLEWLLSDSDPTPALKLAREDGEHWRKHHERKVLA